MWKKLIVSCLLGVAMLSSAAPVSAAYRYWGPRRVYANPYYGPAYYGRPYYGAYGAYGGYGGYGPYGSAAYVYPTPYYAPYSTGFYGGPYVGVYGTTYYY